MEREKVYGFEMIHTEDIAEIMRREQTLLIDVRDEESYRNGHIRNARNFPLPYVTEWVRELPDRISLILYCEHGNQSLLAARRLRGRRGPVYTLIGGYQAYREASKEEAFDGSMHKRD